MGFWHKFVRALLPPLEEAYVPGPRVYPGGSSVELEKRRESLGRELEARLYLFKDKLIVSSVAGIAEYGEPTVLPSNVEQDCLGLCICDHLLQFRPRTPTLDRYAKLRDWKAFQASGAKSGREFRENAWQVRIETMNSAMLMNAGPYNSLHKEITVQGMTGYGPHENIGGTVLRTLRAASILRDSEVI